MIEATIEKVRTIATEYVNRSDSKQCVVKFAEVLDLDHRPSVWVVWFEVYTKDGAWIDSPFAVYVDKKTMEPRYADR